MCVPNAQFQTDFQVYGPVRSFCSSGVALSYAPSVVPSIAPSAIPTAFPTVAVPISTGFVVQYNYGSAFQDSAICEGPYGFLVQALGVCTTDGASWYKYSATHVVNGTFTVIQTQFTDETCSFSFDDVELTRSTLCSQGIYYEYSATYPVTTQPGFSSV